MTIYLSSWGVWTFAVLLGVRCGLYCTASTYAHASKILVWLISPHVRLNSVPCRSASLCTLAGLGNGCYYSHHERRQYKERVSAYAFDIVEIAL